MGILFSIGQFLARGRPQTHEKGSSNSILSPAAVGWPREPAAVKHGDAIVCATTACLRARLGTTLIRSRAKRAPRQGADAKIGRVDLDGPEKIPDAHNQGARREAHLNGAVVNVHVVRSPSRNAVPGTCTSARAALPGSRRSPSAPRD